MIFLEPLTARNSKQRNMKRHRGASLKHQPPAELRSFVGHTFTPPEQGQDAEGTEPGSWFVLCTWETVLLRGAKAARSVPASWDYVTGVSLGKLLNLNTRDVSPCEPQDRSSTSLTGSVDPTVNACERQQQVCAGVGASSLVFLTSSSRRVCEQALGWPVCSTSR